MSKKLSFLVPFLLGLILLSASLALAPATAEAQSSNVISTTDENTIEPPFQAGNLDFTLSAGFSSFLYLHLEPGAELGLIPLGNDLTIGIGGVVNVGYCLLCPLISALPTGISVSSWYVNPMARANLHLGTVSTLLSLPQLDFFVGAIAGPAMYRITIGFDELDTTGVSNQVTLIGGPVVGGRFSLDDRNRWLIFGEARFLLEVGFTENVVRSGDQEYRESGNHGRGGMDVVFGLGYRI
ncbi:MAG: hypothetical protein ACNA8W_16305 [Bradymonadaceae bacterium]